MQIVSLNENIKYSVHLDLSKFYSIEFYFKDKKNNFFLRFELFECVRSVNSPSLNITDFIE